MRSNNIMSLSHSRSYNAGTTADFDNNIVDVAAETNCVTGKQNSATTSRSTGLLTSVSNAFTAALHTIIPPGGVLAGAFNMASASIGAGILGLPSATDASGIVTSMIVLAIITFYSVYSMYILAETAQATKLKSYEDMSRYLLPGYRHAFGYWMATVRAFHGFSSCVVYVIAMSNCLSPIFKGVYEQHPHNATLKYLASTSGTRVITAVAWTFLMLPLSLLRRVDSLRVPSMIAICTMIFFSIIIIMHSILTNFSVNIHKIVLVDTNPSTDDPDSIYLFRKGNNVIPAVGVFVFAYICQVNALETFWDMPASKRNTRNYTWSALIAMMICWTLYLLVSIFGYFDFGSKELYNTSILLLYDPMKHAYLMVAFCAVMFKVCVAYALLCNTSRNAFYGLIGWQYKYSRRTTESGNVTIPDSCDRSRTTLESNNNSADPHTEREREGSDDMHNAGVQDSSENPYVKGEQKKMSTAGMKKRDAARNLIKEADTDSLDEEVAIDKVENLYLDNIPLWKHILVVCSLSTAALICGLLIPKINIVFGFAGSLTGGFLAFISPALFYMYSGMFTVEKVGWINYLTTYSLLISGVFAIVWGTCGTIYSVV